MVEHDHTPSPPFIDIPLTLLPYRMSLFYMLTLHHCFFRCTLWHIATALHKFVTHRPRRMLPYSPGTFCDYPRQSPRVGYTNSVGQTLMRSTVITAYGQPSCSSWCNQASPMASLRNRAMAATSEKGIWITKYKIYCLFSSTMYEFDFGLVPL